MLRSRHVRYSSRIEELQRIVINDIPGKPMWVRILRSNGIVYALVASAEYAFEIDMDEILVRAPMDLNYENSKLRKLFFESAGDRGAYLCTYGRNQLLPSVVALMEEQFALEALQEV